MSDTLKTAGSLDDELDDVLDKLFNQGLDDGVGFSMPGSETYTKEEAIQAIKIAFSQHVIKKDEVFMDIPVVDGSGNVVKVIGGESYTPHMVARNRLRAEMRANLNGRKKV